MSVRNYYFGYNTRPWSQYERAVTVWNYLGDRRKQVVRACKFGFGSKLLFCIEHETVITVQACSVGSVQKYYLRDTRKQVVRACKFVFCSKGETRTQVQACDCGLKGDTIIWVITRDRDHSTSLRLRFGSKFGLYKETSTSVQIWIWFERRYKETSTSVQLRFKRRYKETNTKKWSQYDQTCTCKVHKVSIALITSFSGAAP